LSGVPVEQQGLAFKGKRLENDKTVGESNLVRGSVIDLLPTIQIFVKTPQNKKLPFDVNLGDNILSIKEKVEEKEGLICVRIIHVFIYIYMYMFYMCVIYFCMNVYMCMYLYACVGIAVPQQSLQYHETPLENDQTVGDYNITAGAVIDLLPTIAIIIITPLGKKMILEVSQSDSICSIKRQILAREGVYGFSLCNYYYCFICLVFCLFFFVCFILCVLFVFMLTGIPIDHQGLAHKGCPLEDHRSVGSYNILKGAVIDLLPCIHIIVKTLAGKKIPLDVTIGDSVRSVKEKLQKRESSYSCYYLYLFGCLFYLSIFFFLSFLFFFF
jgi:hypothetical protein